MSRRLILLRHGQTAWNLVGRMQGHCDVELDATGHEQAAAAAPYVAAYQPSALWTSDLSRAARTAAYVARECALEPREDARFRELDLGESAGVLKADYARDEPDLYAALMAGDFSRIPGAEDLATIAQRFGAGIDEVMANLGPAQTAVVVSHGTAIRAGICHAVGWPAELAGTLAGLGNCHWAVLTEHQGPGRFRLETYGLGPGDPPISHP
ncbi:histidine phosphatase family protein [Nocardioides sp. AE5]|uniref:histidine phosphatase family protein n=1 Tax=Nocardioides sp. AE5 TaxID=2962573 RepID=UPI0028824C52|nr:histidine phosphatase family protein [Nocardioides sp. AE5]MDT0201049.1 histidine phosphatase family protein [Nocardioides sp. AE5]